MPAPTLAPTPARQEANRQNSKLSTGPTSETGKKHSSLNALRHALSGQTVLLPQDDRNAYNKFTQGIIASLQAQTAIEIHLAQTIADSHWRINRIKTIEDGMLHLSINVPVAGFEDAQTDDPALHNALSIARAFQENSHPFANLSIYEQRLNRAIKQATQQLKEAIAARKAEQTDAAKTEPQPQPPANGFVFANREITSRTDKKQPSQPDEITDEVPRPTIKSGQNWSRIVNLHQQPYSVPPVTLQ